MPDFKCTHVRIRDDNAYNEDPEEVIKSIQRDYKVDIKSLPQWKHLVYRRHVMTTDCKRQFQNAQFRKDLIIHKLLIESVRPSPFELTANLVRTRKKWENMKILTKYKNKRAVPTCSPVTTPIFESKISVEELEIVDQLEVQDYSLDTAEMTLKNTSEILEVDECCNPTLPLKVVLNEHKFLSPIRSQNALFPCIQKKNLAIACKDVTPQWTLLKRTTSIEILPNVVKIGLNICDQCIKFKIRNISSHFLLIRFGSVTNMQPFSRVEIIPNTQQKVYPGLSLDFRFSFKLRECQQEFATELYFKISRDVHIEDPPEVLFIPVVSDFTKARSVTVPEFVRLPSVYPWQIKRNKSFTSATIEVSIGDGCPYHLHIVKHKDDDEICRKSKTSTSATAGSYHSFDRISETDDFNEEDFEGELDITNHVRLFLEDAVERALDVFLLERTYISLINPHVKKVKFEIYITKISHMGYYNSCYDFLFVEPKCNSVAVVKTVFVFAEILPSPVKIEPEYLLSFTQKSVHQGHCEGIFTILNSHRFNAVHVKIVLSSIQKKLFKIVPDRARVPASSSVQFEVKFCTLDKIRRVEENYVHFVIQILLSGHSSIFNNIPPFYYEIIAPCVSDYEHLEVPSVLAATDNIMF